MGPPSASEQDTAGEESPLHGQSMKPPEGPIGPQTWALLEHAGETAVMGWPLLSGASVGREKPFQ
jgi:hypothetical protein